MIERIAQHAVSVRLRRVCSTAPVLTEVIIGDLIRRQLHELAGIVFQDVVKPVPRTGVSKIIEEDVEYVFRFINSLDLYDPIPLSFLQYVAVERVCRESLTPAVSRWPFSMCDWIPRDSESGKRYCHYQDR